MLENDEQRICNLNGGKLHTGFQKFVQEFEEYGKYHIHNDKGPPIY